MMPVLLDSSVLVAIVGVLYRYNIRILDVDNLIISDFVLLLRLLFVVIKFFLLIWEMLFRYKICEQCHDLIMGNVSFVGNSFI